MHRYDSWLGHAGYNLSAAGRAFYNALPMKKTTLRLKVETIRNLDEKHLTRVTGAGTYTTCAETSAVACPISFDTACHGKLN